VAVALDVLDQSAAQRHVQKLVAAADAEDRQVAVERLLQRLISCSSRFWFGLSVSGLRFSHKDGGRPRRP
jgi:hypothetical protein